MTSVHWLVFFYNLGKTAFKSSLVKINVLMTSFVISSFDYFTLMTRKQRVWKQKSHELFYMFCSVRCFPCSDCRIGACGQGAGPPGQGAGPPVKVSMKPEVQRSLPLRPRCPRTHGRQSASGEEGGLQGDLQDGHGERPRGFLMLLNLQVHAFTTVSLFCACLRSWRCLKKCQIK